MKKNGFAILYAILVITIAVTMSVNVSSVITKERALSRIARDSLDARAAADVGVECMLYNDKSSIAVFDGVSSPNIDCGRDNSGNRITYLASLTSSTINNFTYTISNTGTVNGPCFKSYLDRSLVAPFPTKISVYGYNICDINNKTRVERGIEVSYIGGGTSGINKFTLVANSSASLNSSMATTAAVNTTTANLVVLAITFCGNCTGTFPTVSDSYGNAWIPLPPQLMGTGQDASRLYYAISPIVGPGHTFTVSGPLNSYPSIYMTAFKSPGVPTFDQQMGGTMGGTRVSPGVITPSGNNALVVIAGNAEAGTVTVFDSGIITSNSQSYVPSINFGGAMGYKMQTTPVSINPFMSTNGTYFMLSSVMATFLP